MRSEILSFVIGMKPSDHAIMFYRDQDEKHQVLFTYLREGLKRGEAAAYVAADESPREIEAAMKRFGIDVERETKRNALKIIHYRDWYITDEGFNKDRTVNLWKSLLKKSLQGGFEGLRVTGEMTCFFDHNLIEDLIDYERFLHRRLSLPLAAICAYDTKKAMDVRGWEFIFLSLIRMHSATLIVGPKNELIQASSPEEIGILESTGKSLNETFQECVYKSLDKILGRQAADVLVYAAKRRCRGRPETLEETFRFLDETIGLGSLVLKRRILRNLYSKVGLEP